VPLLFFFFCFFGIKIIVSFSFWRVDLGIVRRGGGCCCNFFKLKKILPFFFGDLIFFARFVKS